MISPLFSRPISALGLLLIVIVVAVFTLNPDIRDSLGSVIVLMLALTAGFFAVIYERFKMLQEARMLDAAEQDEDYEARE